jgi:hypothetical protein
MEKVKYEENSAKSYEMAFARLSALVFHLTTQYKIHPCKFASFWFQRLSSPVRYVHFFL